MTRLSGDCIALPAGPDRWILYNVRTRTSLGVDGAALAAAARDVHGPEQSVEGEPFSVWDVGWFSQAGGTLDDPTRLRRDASDWGAPRRLAAAALSQELETRWLIVSDSQAYRTLFERPRHPLESQRLGNFHDQLGRHLIVERRENPSAWWVSQKFRADGTMRDDNAYGTVQWPALSRYFDVMIRPGMRILDVGCGTGIYSAEMGKRGAEVLGIDPSASYIAEANARDAPHCEFLHVPLDATGRLDGLPSAAADVVFMSDALMFSFLPISQQRAADPGAVLQMIRQALRPSGRFVSIEPHGDFYLAPWMGELGRPWTVLTEHRSRRFATAPTFPVMAGEVLTAGFVLTYVEELYRADDKVSGDARADAFADEFPLWTLAEYARDDRA